MKTDEKLRKLEELLETDKNSLTPETELADVEEWDSIAKLSLVVFMNEEFDKKLDGKQVKGLKTVNDILVWME